MVGLNDDVINYFYAVNGPEYGGRLRVIVVSVLEMCFVKVRNNTPVGVSKLASACVVFLICCERRQVFLLKLELVASHVGNLPKVLVVGANLHEDLITITGIVEHENKATVTQRCDDPLAFGLPRLHLVPLIIGRRLESPESLLVFRISPLHKGRGLVREDKCNIRTGHPFVWRHRRAADTTAHAPRLLLRSGAILEEEACRGMMHEWHDGTPKCESDQVNLNKCEQCGAHGIGCFE